MDMLERIQDLCKRSGINPSKLEIELGFGKGTLYKWDKSSPSTDKLSKVANYLKVSTDYLLFGFEKSRIIILVEAARCGRTIEQFSKEVNVDEEYLNSICNGDITEPPSPEILKSIMDSPDSQLISDYYELMEAAGHIDHQTALEHKIEELKVIASENSPKSDDEDIRRIERARKNMTDQDKKRMMKILEASFDEAFDD